MGVALKKKGPDKYRTHHILTMGVPNKGQIIGGGS